MAASAVPSPMATVVIGSLTPDECASCTQLVCGTDCVLAIGLCGRFRAWQVDGSSWRLALDLSSSYELANSRRSSHPYRYLSPIAADGRFTQRRAHQRSTRHRARMMRRSARRAA